MDLTANQLLMRGFRPIYTDVWQTYNLNQHICEPPKALADKFPEQGVNLSAFKEGSPIRLKWSAYTAPENKDVSEDLKDDVSELLDIIDRVDKDKDYNLTNAEWIAAHKNSKPEDELFDREYVLLAKGIFDFQALPSNPGIVDPENYPELKDARREMKEKDAKSVELQKERDQAREDASLYQTLTTGLGAVLGVSALALAIRAGLRRSRRKSEQKTQTVQSTPAQTQTPTVPTSGPQQTAPARIDAPAPQAASSYASVLEAVPAVDAVDPELLAALEEQEAVAGEEAAQGQVAPKTV